MIEARLPIIIMFRQHPFSHSVDNFTADDSHGEAAGPLSPTTGLPRPRNSFFNKAFREALKDKRMNIYNIHHAVQSSKCYYVKVMCRHPYVLLSLV